MIRGGSPPHPHDMATANRTLPSDKNSNLHLLATSLSKAICNSERSASVTIQKFPVASSRLCSCRGVAECGDPLVSLLIGMDVEKNSSWARNLAPAFCNAHATKLQVHVHDSHRVSVRICIHLLATLLSKLSRNFERSASVAIPGFHIQ